ncbi:MAG: hypothetical protein Q4C61_00385 [Lachnospiraceae bacterium]|nr:hypothetical protein [Lachnospiraceae bacterium]
MKKRGRKGLIHLLAAFWLLITGICIDCSQAYSILAYHDTFESARCSYDSSNGFASDEICTSDLMGQRTVVRDAKKLESPGTKGRTSLRSMIAVPEVISQTPRLYCSMVCGQIHRGVCSHTVIMNYIHSKDGRKS